MKEILRAGGIVLPAPVSMTINDELIWTSDTGRLMNGLMVGEVVAEKKNVSLKWGILTEAEMSQIRSKTLSKEVLGRLSDGIFYYKSVSVDLIER